jgi:hypothetical protein
MSNKRYNKRYSEESEREEEGELPEVVRRIRMKGLMILLLNLRTKMKDLSHKSKRKH